MPEATEPSTVALADDADDMTDRILDAALGHLLDFGIRRLTVEDVARRAGVARVTIYRRFSSRAELLQATLLREGQRTFDAIDATIAELDEAEDRIVEGFVAAMRAARAHPLMTRTLSTEPELLAEVVINHGGPVMAIAREYLADHIRRVQKDGQFDAVDAQQVAELTVRLASSFMLTPQSCIPLDSEADLRAFARAHLLPAYRSWSEAPTQ